MNQNPAYFTYKDPQWKKDKKKLAQIKIRLKKKQNEIKENEEYFQAEMDKATGRQ